MLDRNMHNALTEDDMDKIVGGMDMTGFEEDLRRIKCPNCGDLIMVSMNKGEADCSNPDCRCHLLIDKNGNVTVAGKAVAAAPGGKTLSGGPLGRSMLA